MMGRVDDIAGAEKDPLMMYVGFATGGLWKSTDGGNHWTSLFDNMPNESIGAIAIAPSNPNIVYVGTGEANNRQSSSIGDGVWGTTDGGKHWTHLGLEDTQSIARIVVDPTNPNIVYVAALGHLFGPNPNAASTSRPTAARPGRNPSSSTRFTGFTDVAIDPSNPKIVYAASYNARRTWWGYNGGGPGSRPLEIDRRRRHLDSASMAPVGRSEGRHLRPHRDLDLHAPSRPRLRAGGSRRERRHGRRHRRRRLAPVARGRGGRGAASGRGGRRSRATAALATEPGAAARHGAGMRAPAAPDGRTRRCLPPPPDPNGSGVYRSDDGGKTWTFMSNQNQRPMYFSQIRVDPSTTRNSSSAATPRRCRWTAARPGRRSPARTPTTTPSGSTRRTRATSSSATTAAST